MEAALESAPVKNQAPPAAEAEGKDSPPVAETKPALPADPDTYSFSDMRMKVGDRAQLEPPQYTGAGRAQVKVVGWLEGESWIVTLPHTRAGWIELCEGEIVLLRVFTGRRAFAFKSTVLKTAHLPFKHLHLSLPDHAEGQVVRDALRCRVDLPATFTPADGKGPTPGRIENISASGALLESTASLGDEGANITLEVELELHGVPTSLRLQATIRSVKCSQAAASAGDPKAVDGAKVTEDAEAAPKPGNYKTGVSFKDLAANDRLILGALIWYELHEHPNSAA